MGSKRPRLDEPLPEPLGWYELPRTKAHGTLRCYNNTETPLQASTERGKTLEMPVAVSVPVKLAMLPFCTLMAKEDPRDCLRYVQNYVETVYLGTEKLVQSLGSSPISTFGWFAAAKFHQPDTPGEPICGIEGGDD
ncbi:MAG: hypothetical protein M1816_005057 [Peltula sp. TS41687]|nr:MAG: hypothetical protein M1816_005057 [Peltula sp. TS41687]